MSYEWMGRLYATEGGNVRLSPKCFTLFAAVEPLLAATMKKWSGNELCCYVVMFTFM